MTGSTVDIGTSNAGLYRNGMTFKNKKMDLETMIKQIVNAAANSILQGKDAQTEYHARIEVLATVSAGRLTVTMYDNFGFVNVGNREKVLRYADGDEKKSTADHAFVYGDASCTGLLQVFRNHAIDNDSKIIVVYQNDCDDREFDKFVFTHEQLWEGNTKTMLQTNVPKTGIYPGGDLTSGIQFQGLRVPENADISLSNLVKSALSEWFGPCLVPLADEKIDEGDIGTFLEQGLLSSTVFELAYNGKQVGRNWNSFLPREALLKDIGTYGKTRASEKGKGTGMVLVFDVPLCTRDKQGLAVNDENVDASGRYVICIEAEGKTASSNSRRRTTVESRIIAGRVDKTHRNKFVDKLVSEDDDDNSIVAKFLNSKLKKDIDLLNCIVNFIIDITILKCR